MFRELYYWMYSTLRKVKTNDMPAFNAYILICLLQIFNILTIAAIINYFLKIEMKSDIATYTGLGLTFIMVIINRFLLYNKREFIFKQYDNMPVKRRTKGKIFFWLYVSLSVVIFFVAIANLVSPISSPYGY